MTVPMIPTLINGRWTLNLPEHRAVRPQWKIENGGWEPERLASMAEHIGPGDVVYDIGAEEGDLPALWALWGAEVVLFEPNPKVWPNIRAIFDGNGLTNHLLEYWVGFAGEWRRDRDAFRDEFAQAAVDGWPMCAHGPIIGDHGFLVLPERPDVPCTTIDWMATQTKPPTCITMDVEGAELTVLRGADEVLRTYRPKVWVSVHIDLPWIDEKYPGDTFEKVEEYMGQRGYRGTHLATDHEMHMFYEPVGIFTDKVSGLPVFVCAGCGGAGDGDGSDHECPDVAA